MRIFPVIIFYTFVSIFLMSATSNTTDMIQIVHPDLELYYLNMLKSTELSKQNQFLKITKEEKRQICLSSVQSYLFHATDDSESTLKEPRLDIRKSIEETNKLYHKNIPDSVKYYNIATVVKAVVLKVNAHRCRSTPERKLFLTHGDLLGNYITLGKDHENYYKIRGLLEPVPEVSSINDSKNKFALNEHLMRKMKEMAMSEAAKKKNRRMCELTNLQKVRLCSAVYVVYRQYIGEKVRRRNSLNKSRLPCLKNALIDLESGDGLIEGVNMDLIKCTISSGSLTEVFYLADDVYSSNSAYVLQATDPRENIDSRLFEETDVFNDDSSATTFYLALHVNKLIQFGDSL